MLLAATASWRFGRGIYLYDQNLATELWGGEPVDKLPAEVMWRLPEWCVYISFEQNPKSGCYASLEWEPYTARPMLALTMEHPYTHYTFDRFELFLDTQTIEESIELKLARHRDIGKSETEIQGLKGYLSTLGKLASAFLPLVTYLCSNDPDVVRRDGSPMPNKPRRPSEHVDHPTIWESGWHIGTALIESRNANEMGEATHAQPRPHIRRAHFHHFWTGPRDGERTLVVRWLHPILVRGDVDDLTTTIRPAD